MNLNSHNSIKNKLIVTIFRTYLWQLLKKLCNEYCGNPLKNTKVFDFQRVDTDTNGQHWSNDTIKNELILTIFGTPWGALEEGK